MPALRTIKATNRAIVVYRPSIPVSPKDEATDTSICDIEFPTPGSRERARYRRKDGKKVSEHAWAVYDYLRNIPVGKVVTYKAVADALGEGSPRSIGGAVRHNPFPPAVPCHRVIASNLFIGGFFGEWGKQPGATDEADHSLSQCDKKLDLLAREGVPFDTRGMLKSRNFLWNGRLKPS